MHINKSYISDGNSLVLHSYLLTVQPTVDQKANELSQKSIIANSDFIKTFFLPYLYGKIRISHKIAIS